ncbi:MAG: Veg family protein [Actinomycetota bacterium]
MARFVFGKDVVMQESEIVGANPVGRIRRELVERVGSRIKVRAPHGRKPVLVTQQGELLEVHPRVFILKVMEGPARMRRCSFSYADVVMGEVTLWDEGCEESLFEWLREKTEVGG